VPGATVTRRALRGTLWLSAANYGAYVVTFVSDILLARLLFPDDFGTVALAVSVLEIVSRLTTIGVGTAIVQHRSDDEADEQRFLATALTLELAVGVGICVVVGVAAAALRGVYGQQVTSVLLVLAVGRAVQTVNQVPGALLQRRMMFRQDAAISFVSLGLSAAVGVLLAWLGFGAWSLVVKRLVRVVVSGTAAWITIRWMPRFAWDRAALRSIWRFARSMWLSGNLQVVLNELDDAAIGTVGDTEALGYYSRAWKLSRLFMEFVAPAIMRTSLPAYSELQDDRRALSSVFGIVQRVTARMSALFFLLAGVLSPAVIVILYGGQWLPAVPLFHVMTAYGFFKSLFDQYVQLFLAAGMPGGVTRIRLAQALVFVPGVFLGAALAGALGVAIVVDLTMALGMALAVRRGRGLVNASFVRAVASPLASAAVALAAAYGVRQVVPRDRPWLELLVLGPSIVVVFGACLLVLDRKSVLRDLHRIRRVALERSAS